MPAFLGRVKMATCYIGPNKLKEAYVGKDLVCRDGYTKWRFLSFRSGYRDWGQHGGNIEVDNMALQNKSSITLATLNTDISGWSRYINKVLTSRSTIPQNIAICNMRADSSWGSYGVTEVEIFGIKPDGSETYAGTFNFGGWSNSQRQIVGVNFRHEPKPDEAASNFVMNIYQAPTYSSDSFGVYIPLLQIYDENNVEITSKFECDFVNTSAYTGNSAEPTETFRPTSTQGWDSHKDNNPKRLGFKTMDGSKVIIRRIKIGNSPYPTALPTIWRVCAVTPGTRTKLFQVMYVNGNAHQSNVAVTYDNSTNPAKIV